MNQPHANSSESQYPESQIVPYPQPNKQGVPYQYPEKIPAYQYPEKYSEKEDPAPETPDFHQFEPPLQQPEPPLAAYPQPGQQFPVPPYPEQQFVGYPQPIRQPHPYPYPGYQPYPIPPAGYFQQEPIQYQSVPGQIPQHPVPGYQQAYQPYPYFAVPAQHPGSIPQWLPQEQLPVYEQQGFYEANQLRPVGYGRAHVSAPVAPEPAPKNDLRVQFSHSMKPVVSEKTTRGLDLLTVFATILLVGTVLVLVLLSIS